MREALLIARREYLENVRSRAFRVSTVLIPLVFVAIFAISALPGAMPSTSGHIVVASNDPVLANSTRMELLRENASKGDQNNLSETSKLQGGSSQIVVTVMAPAMESDLTALNSQVKSKAIDGYLWLHVVPGNAQPEATYVSRSSADFLGAGKMRTAIGNALVREALMQHGVASAQADVLLHRVKLNTRQIKDGESVASDTGKSFWGAYIMAFVLYFAVVFYGMNVAHSVVAEKTSRVFEVLLATARPESLMAGKLLGVGAAGLTQMAVWIGALLVLGVTALGGQIGQGGLAVFGITPMQLIFFV
ncbi:MAG: ABC transporter permease, partial [Acidobacteriaceae bacterium]